MKQPIAIFLVLLLLKTIETSSNKQGGVCHTPYHTSSAYIQPSQTSSSSADLRHLFSSSPPEQANATTTTHTKRKFNELKSTPNNDGYKEDISIQHAMRLIFPDIRNNNNTINNNNISSCIANHHFHRDVQTTPPSKMIISEPTSADSHPSISSFGYSASSNLSSFTSNASNGIYTPDLKWSSLNYNSNNSNNSHNLHNLHNLHYSNNSHNSNNSNNSFASSGSSFFTSAPHEIYLESVEPNRMQVISDLRNDENLSSYLDDDDDEGNDFSVPVMKSCQFVTVPVLDDSQLRYGHFLSELNENDMRCNSADFDGFDGFNGFGLDLAISSKDCDDFMMDLSGVNRSDSAFSFTQVLNQELIKASLDSADGGLDELFTFDPSSSQSPEPLSNEAIEREYNPWIPISNTLASMPDLDLAIETNYKLPPLPTHFEAIEESDDELDVNHFRDSDFKPFQNYGNLIVDEDKIKSALNLAKEHYTQKSDELASNQADSVKAKADRKASNARYSAINSFLKNNNNNSGIIEVEWFKKILRNESVDFVSYCEEIKNSDEISKWTVKRGRQFLTILIPIIFDNAHFEEVLSDFITDFFLPLVVKRANDAMRTESDRIELSGELTKVSIELIKSLISPEIFDKFVSYIQPVIIESDANLLYKNLVETMKKFKVPKPFVPGEFIAPPGKPSRRDQKYKQFKGTDAKLAAYEDDMKIYMATYDSLLEAFNRKNARKQSYQEDTVRVKKIQKTRSFVYLKILVTNFGDPIMKPDSKWINAIYLQLPKEADGVKTDAITGKRKEEKVTGLSLVMGPNAHENQDFFDCLFFARILRACLVLDNTISMVAIHLEPFLNSYKINQLDSPLGFRYLFAINKFINITRINVVANVLPQIINYRRYLLAFLTKNGANCMGIEPKKVLSRSITLELFSLFESLLVYQMAGQNSLEQNAERLEAIFTVKNLDFGIPIIFVAYNPVKYSTICSILRNVRLSDSRISAYKEIFASIKNVKFLSVFERKVIKFRKQKQQQTGPTRYLANNNQNLPLRPQLPENYDAIYNWTMSKALKDLLKVSVNLHFPYALFSARVLLARQFGVSFDASNYLAQLKENFEWLEAIDFVNFFLEREAQMIILGSNEGAIDSSSYQVYRVQDPQRYLHLHRQMPSDEPTHHINLLISRALSQFPEEEAERVRSAYKGDALFKLVKRGIINIDPFVVMDWPSEVAVKVLRFFLNPKNIPERFDINLI